MSKKDISNSNIRAFLVQDESGNDSFDLTVDNFSANLESYLSHENADLGTIREAITTVYDENPGATLNALFVKREVCQILKATRPETVSPAQITRTEKRINDCLVSMTAKSKEEALATGREFVLLHGRDGGRVRASDMKEEQTEQK